MKHKKLLLCLVLFAYLALCTVLCSASCSTTSHFSSASSANSALERWRTNTANCLRCHKVVSLKRKSKSSLGSIQINAEHSPTFHRPSTSLKSINVLMLLFYGTLGSVMPYLPIFYKHIGANEAEIGLLGAITPAMTFIVSPLWGVLADLTGCHKEIMLLTFLGSVLSRCFLSFCQNKNMGMLSSIVAISAVLNAPVKPLLDAAIMSSLIDKSAYGKCRLFGQIGFGLGSYIVGPFSTPNTPLRFIFLSQLLLAIPTTILMLSFELEKGSASTVSIKDEAPLNAQVVVHLTNTLKDPHVIAFFIVVFIIGISSGIIENFAYVRIAEVVGATDSNILGTCRLASSMAGGPMFWLSNKIVQYLGVEGVLTLSLLSYVARFYTYALMKSAWHAFPAELLRGMTFAAFWSGATYYVYGISPAGLTATMLGLLNGVYAGIGQSLGSLLGGILCKKLGISQAFLCCAWLDMAIVGFFVTYQVLQKRRSSALSSVKNLMDN